MWTRAASGFLNIEMNGMNPSDPIEGATIKITEHRNPNKVIKTVVTDKDGQVPDVELPAPAASPNADWDPHTKYDLLVEIPSVDGHARASYTYAKNGIEIYDGRTTNNHDELSYIMGLETAMQDGRATFAINLPDSTIADQESMVYQDPDQFADKTSPGVFSPLIRKPFVPSYINIYLGRINPYVPRVSINNKKVIKDTFKQYIKRVCAIEFGGIAKLSEQAIYANTLAVISFVLNRMYTEVYVDKGYPFTITNSTAFDQHYPAGGFTNQRVDEIIDKIFDQYIKKGKKVQPYFSQYCAKHPCQNKGMSQLESNRMALNGRSYMEILKRFYGDDLTIEKAEKVTVIPNSYPGHELKKGMTDPAVGAMKGFLNVIRKSYPAIPQLNATDLFDEQTEKAVKKFQEINKKKLKVANGIVNEPTWRLIGEKYYFLGGQP
ncbi:Peptidoglycan-binding domain 1 protein [Paenibacillus curdlanolyticus YK9]|uniref:Peptidoglycan-binding domain 1 protein n=1 Tax=Paenibacillus curdlanolyticus YK9 TaxID=717606 RepID=E0IA99_9BACL|nr:peptidoglycan-binding domain-containing protein [Paenibacillus curdlanolyticus]EFM10676.1 Peptidoglycan-binding domain 1 protein [Paenibacillus curdlanolyticus YK9]